MAASPTVAATTPAWPERWVPHAPTKHQQALLALEFYAERDRPIECLYGGSAGGGKTQGLLMAALQYVDVPGYAAMIFRKTYSDLALPGAIMARSKEWLTGRVTRTLTAIVRHLADPGVASAGL